MGIIINWEIDFSAIPWPKSGTCEALRTVAWRRLLNFKFFIINSICSIYVMKNYIDAITKLWRRVLTLTIISSPTLPPTYESCIAMQGPPSFYSLLRTPPCPCMITQSGHHFRTSTRSKHKQMWPKLPKKVENRDDAKREGWRAIENRRIFRNQVNTH